MPRPSASASLRGRPRTRMRRLDDVAEHGHVRPQIELLEHHAEFAAHRVDLASERGLAAPRGIDARRRAARRR